MTERKKPAVTVDQIGNLCPWSRRAFLRGKIKNRKTHNLFQKIYQLYHKRFLLFGIVFYYS